MEVRKRRISFAARDLVVTALLFKRPYQRPWDLEALADSGWLPNATAMLHAWRTLDRMS